jgi:hypothetical protein
MRVFLAIRVVLDILNLNIFEHISYSIKGLLF